MSEPRRRTRRRVLAMWVCAGGMSAAFATVPLIAGEDRTPTGQSYLNIAEAGEFNHNLAHQGATAEVKAVAAARLAACDDGTATPDISCPETGATARAVDRAENAADAVRPASSTQPDGMWGPLLPIPSTAIHAAVLPTGKVLFFSQPKWPTEDELEGGNAHLFDPATGTTTSVPPPVVHWPTGPDRPANLWCGGQVQLADGRLLVVGGNLAYPQNGGLGAGNGFKGGRWVMTFDPWTETWTRYADMRHGRWYPTLTELPNGDVLIVGGWDESGGVDNGGASAPPDMVNDQDVEIFHPGAAPGSQATEIVSQLPPNGPGQPRPWPDHRRLSVYPHMFVLPSTTALGAGGHKVLVAGPGEMDSAVIDTETWVWTDVRNRSTPDSGQPRLSQYRYWSTAWLEPSDTRGSTRVVIQGGAGAGTGTVNPAPGPGQSDPPQSSAEVLDLNRPDAGWTLGAAPALNLPRAHFNTVLLPDGGLFSNGGGYGRRDNSLYADPVYQAEYRAPGDTAWRVVGAEQDARTYHSVSVLLPDARVLSAGDDRDIAPEHISLGGRTAQIWSPPYLFDGPRPVIRWAPSQIRYDVDLRVAVKGDPSQITGAALVHPGAVTHAVDMAQRVVRLDVTAQSDGVTVRTPLDDTVAPPGHYMLFLFNARGVPSEAAWIRVYAQAPDPPAIPPPDPDPAPAPPSTTPAPPRPFTALSVWSRPPVVAARGARLRVRLTARPTVAAAVEMTVRLPGGRVLARRAMAVGAGTTVTRDLTPLRRAVGTARTLRAVVRAEADGTSVQRAFTVRVPR